MSRDSLSARCQLSAILTSCSVVGFSCLRNFSLSLGSYTPVIRPSNMMSSRVIFSKSHSRAFDFLATHQSENGSRGSWTCLRKLYRRTNRGDSLRKILFNLSRHPPSAKIGVASCTPSSVFKALSNFRSNTLFSNCLEMTIDLSTVFLLWSK